ncbi:MAG: hypothetical protein LBH19_03390 [Dysgonamonadaceae bacterium]|jgi:hypothetical protein|nr:hypothetical protein [Dysgonamonadaceae bacterium]
MIKNFRLILLLFALYACENAEDISNKMDHEVPYCKVLTDSLAVLAGQSASIQVEVSDNAGLDKMVLSYGNWMLRESISLKELNNPKSYRFETTVKVPEDAAKEWMEEVIMNTGASYTITQYYHKLVLEATDINMNVRNIPVYIKVE